MVKDALAGACEIEGGKTVFGLFEVDEGRSTFVWEVGFRKKR